MIELGKNKTTLSSCAIVAVLRFATILVARLLGLMLSTLFVVGLPNW